MSVVLDPHTASYLGLWTEFRAERAPDFGGPADPSSAVAEGPLKGPAETLAQLWEKGVQGPARRQRDVKILARVRAWLEGAARSAEDDRRQVQALFERCALRPRLGGWQRLSSSDRDQALEQLLRTVGGLSAVIRQERPRTPGAIAFRIDWREDGDGTGYWETASPQGQFPLKDAVRDLADLHGRFDPETGDAVAQQILQDLRDGTLELPLLPRGPSSNRQTAWLRHSPPGDDREAGLLLPEPNPAVAEEAVLWREALPVAQVYEEALFLAAEENVEPLPPDWDQVPAQESLEDAQETQHVKILCEELQKVTALPPRKVCLFLAAPLHVIRVHSASETLRRRAGSSLAVLRQFLDAA